MAERIELKVPALGDFSDVEVIEVLVSPGDTVAVEDGLVARLQAAVDAGVEGVALSAGGHPGHEGARDLERE